MMNERIAIIGGGGSERAASSQLLENGLADVTILDSQPRRDDVMAIASLDENAFDQRATDCLSNHVNARRSELQNGHTIESKSDETMSASGKSEHHVDVLILGAGLAGLGAATAIKRSNSKIRSFLILEADSRAGGRVHTIDMIDFVHQRRIIDDAIDMDRKDKYEREKFIDSGAQWLHGKCNYVHEFATKFHLLSDEQSEEGLGAFLFENSLEIDPFVVKKIDFVIGQLLGDCELFAHQNGLSVPASVGQYLRERFGEYLQSIEDENERKQSRDLFDWHWRFQIIDNSCLTLDQLSAKYWGKYSFNGEPCQAHYNFRNGFGAVVSELTNQLGEAAIVYNQTVEKISLRSNGMATVQVQCTDGRVYSANHVLVTFSLGVLKAKHRTMFEPTLPMPFQHAIENIGFGTINKIFMQFATAWWGNLDGIQFIFSHDESESKHWTQFLSGFDVVRPGAPNTLLGWVGGRGAIEMEAFTDKEIIADCVKMLAKFTKADVPLPIRYFCSRWHSNPYVRGAYSFLSTDCEKTESSYRQLSQLLSWDDLNGCGGANEAATSNANQSQSEPILFFAGEACHEKYFSTAHGAFICGMEQMQKLLAIYN